MIIFNHQFECCQHGYHLYYFLPCLSQANNTMQVNTIRVPDSDIMATNGVIHFVDNVLYPGGIISLHPFKPLICQKRLGDCFKYEPRLTPCVFHSDIPVGSQDFHMLLKRLVSYMQLKVRRRF